MSGVKIPGFHVLMKLVIDALIDRDLSEMSGTLGYRDREYQFSIKEVK